MAEDTPSLHIDTDWKKQAQEEKKRLAEQEQQRKAAASAPRPEAAASPAAAVAPAGPTAAAAGRGAAPAQKRGEREMPPASVATLVQSIMTQVLLYLGELSARGGEPMLNLDLAKHHIDTLGVIDEKMQGNLTPDEQRLIDTALHETRSRFVAAASEIINYP